MKNTGAIYFGENSVIKFETGGATPTHVTPKTEHNDLIEKFEKDKVIRWGYENNYPSKFLKQLRCNGAANGGLRVLKSVHYGGGLVFHKTTVDDFGKRQRHLIPLTELPEIKSFFKSNRMNKFLIETISDLETWSMACPEYILSKDFKKIVQVNRLKTAWHRKASINKKKGYTETIFYNSRWDTYEFKDDDNTAKVKALPSWWSAEQVREHCKKKNLHKFCIPINYPMTDEGYYNKTEWHAAYRNGWFEVSNSIAKLKKALFENQINIKFIIYVEERYLEMTYSDKWHEMKPDEKEEIRKELVQKIDEHMSGSDGFGRSLFATNYTGPDGKTIDSIRVVPIDNKLKEGSYLPEASAANSEILFCLGVDPSLIGHGVPGGKLGAGSGSDKREAYILLQQILKPRRKTTLEIWDFLQEYNNWDTSIEATFEDTVLTTLDKNPNGQSNMTS